MLSERAGALDEERRLALLHCVLCHHGPASAPGGRFGSAEALALYRINALDAAVKGALERSSTACAVVRPNATADAVPDPRQPGPTPARAGAPIGARRTRTITRGAARAWWPIQSSKLAGPGSPRLGRFDSFAASLVDGTSHGDGIDERQCATGPRLVQ